MSAPWPGAASPTLPSDARPSRSRRETAAGTPWDLPLRLFHLGLLLSVGTALITAWVGGNAMVWHGRAGAAVAGLLGFRLVWGVVGSPTSQFRQFLPGPAALRDYLRGRWQGVGHNPLGALAVVAILVALGGQVLTGLFSNDEIAFTGPYASAVSEAWSLRLTGWHQRLAWGVYGLLALHAAAIAVHVLVKRHRLLGPMFRLRPSSQGGQAASPVPGGPAARRQGRAPLAWAVGVGLVFAAAAGWDASAPSPAPAASVPASAEAPPKPAAW